MTIFYSHWQERKELFSLCLAPAEGGKIRPLFSNQKASVNETETAT